MNFFLEIIKIYWTELNWILDYEDPLSPLLSALSYLLANLRENTLIFLFSEE